MAGLAPLLENRLDMPREIHLNCGWWRQNRDSLLGEDDGNHHDSKNSKSGRGKHFFTMLTGIDE